MTDFNLKRFLTENKLTSNSKKLEEYGNTAAAADNGSNLYDSDDYIPYEFLRPGMILVDPNNPEKKYAVVTEPSLPRSRSIGVVDAETYDTPVMVKTYDKEVIGHRSDQPEEDSEEELDENNQEECSDCIPFEEVEKGTIGCC